MAKEKSLVLAEHICSEHKLMYVQEHGKIYIYQNGCYVLIYAPNSSSELHRLISLTTEGCSFTPAKRDATIRNIQMLTAVNEQDVNPEGIFNFQDMIYDIRNGSDAAHSPDYKITIQLPYRLKQSVDAPLWNEFLIRVTEGDQEKINLLQEFCGYCLMKSCRFEKALFLLGRGSNGKSVFSETISKVFGSQNISSVSLENLANPMLRCGIINKYINIDSDLPRNSTDFEEAFRKITSGEPIQFNPKYIPPFTQPSYCKLIYCLNEFPPIDDSSNAFYRRVILVPFEVEFDSDSQDADLKSKLEQELAGIFHWCVAGYRRLIKSGFSRNSYMESLIHELKVDNNPVMAFSEEFIQFNMPNNGIIKRDLYKEFRKWALDHGHKPPSYRKFNNKFYNEYRSFTVKDAQLKDGDRDRFWPNISYKNTTHQGGVFTGTLEQE